jgi:hypothetical protein
MSVIAWLRPLSLRRQWVSEAKIVKHPIIPRDATVAELEQKANDAEKQSVKEPERATELRELAKLYREWITQLESGRWTS